MKRARSSSCRASIRPPISHTLWTPRGSAPGLARRSAAPVIHFGTATAVLLPDFARAGGDVIGVDWRIPLDIAWERIGPDRAIQGNLDPAALLAPLPELEQRVRDVLDRAAGRAGHIFNLWHGVRPETAGEALQRVVDLVHGG